MKTIQEHISIIQAFCSSATYGFLEIYKLISFEFPYHLTSITSPGSTSSPDNVTDSPVTISTEPAAR